MGHRSGQTTRRCQVPSLAGASSVATPAACLCVTESHIENRTRLERDRGDPGCQQRSGGAFDRRKIRRGLRARGGMRRFEPGVGTSHGRGRCTGSGCSDGSSGRSAAAPGAGFGAGFAPGPPFAVCGDCAGSGRAGDKPALSFASRDYKIFLRRTFIQEASPIVAQEKNSRERITDVGFCARY